MISFPLERSSRLPHESLHEVGERQQVGEPHEGAPLAEDDLWVRLDDVRPARRHRANAVLLDAQQEPLAVAVEALREADELSSVERVERVGHAHKTRRCVGRACILSRVTNGSSAAASPFLNA
jgi:hypothetical protein